MSSESVSMRIARPIMRCMTAFTLLLFLSAALYASKRGISRVEIKTQSGEVVGLYEESHALVIGVRDYTAGLPRLGGAREVVREVGYLGFHFNAGMGRGPVPKQHASCL